MTTTLLGVDDSKTLRKVLEITFAGEDVRTVLAENPDDAMSKLHAERPSIVLLDAALEGTNGYDLCQRVKAATPGVGVILLSSKQQPYDRNRGQQVGADDFIDKPFDTQQLIDKVGTVLRRLSSTSQPMTSTAHGVGPVPVAPMAAARPAPELGSRMRTQTLAYGSHQNPMAAGPGPVAPLVPPPVGAVAPAAAARPNLTPSPAPVAAPQPAAAVTETPKTGGATGLSSANGTALVQKLTALGLTAEQVSGVLALSREVVEQVVWEVVPTLAEKMIEEEIRRLTAE